MGQEVLPPPPEPVDPNSVIVRFNLPLRNVRLKDVLDAVVKVADKPLTYSVEDYGVVLSLDAAKAAAPQFGGGPLVPRQPYGLASISPAPEVLEVRTFRVDTNTFLSGLESAFGITVGTAAPTPQLDLEKQGIELRLAEKELQETQRKFSVGAVPTESQKPKQRGLLEPLTTRQERIDRLAEQDLQRVSKCLNRQSSDLGGEREGGHRRAPGSTRKWNRKPSDSDVKPALSNRRFCLFLS